MKFFTLVLALFTFTLSAAQEPQEYQFPSFDSLKVFDLITVNLVKSDAPRVVVSGRDASYVEVIKKGNLLKIRMSSDRIFDGENTFVYVYYTDLVLIDGNEGSRIYSNELLELDQLEIKVQEGATVEAGLAVENLDLRAVTGGIIELKGTARFQDVVVNTGGIINNSLLKTDHTKVKVQAGGEVDVYASQSVDVNVRAGGDVTVYGNPTKVKEKTLLGGRIDFKK